MEEFHVGSFEEEGSEVDLKDRRGWVSGLVAAWTWRKTMWRKRRRRRSLRYAMVNGESE